MGKCGCGGGSSRNRYRWQDIIGIPTCITDCDTLEEFILTVVGGGGPGGQDLQSVTDNGITTSNAINITGLGGYTGMQEGVIIGYNAGTAIITPDPTSVLSIGNNTFSANLGVNNIITSSDAGFTINNRWENEINGRTGRFEVNSQMGGTFSNIILRRDVSENRPSAFDVSLSNTSSLLDVRFPSIGSVTGSFIRLSVDNGSSTLFLDPGYDLEHRLVLKVQDGEAPSIEYDGSSTQGIGLRLTHLTNNVTTFYRDGRVSGSPAVNGDEFVTKDQVNSGVSSLTGMTTNAPSGVDATVNGSASYIGNIAYVTITITIATTSSGTMDDTEIIINNIPLNIDTSAGYHGQGGIYYWGPEERQVSPNQKNSISGKFTFYDISGTTRATLNYTEGINNMNLLSWGDLDYTFTDGFPYKITLNGVLYLNV